MEQINDNPNVRFKYRGREYKVNLAHLQGVVYYKGRRSSKRVVIQRRLSKLYKEKKPFLAMLWNPYRYDGWFSGRWNKPCVEIRLNGQCIEIPCKTNDEAREVHKELKNFLYREIKC